MSSISFSTHIEVGRLISKRRKHPAPPMQEAWKPAMRLGEDAAPYSTSSPGTGAKLPLPLWVQFMNAHVAVKEAFEYEVMRSMSEIMAHTITLHLLDAPGRVHRFLRKHPDFSDRVPKKELASHLNLCAETLSRLQHQGKIELR